MTHRSIIHVDMDAFYAQIEQRDNPKLVGKPVIIGGTSSRGVVSTASYEARRYGVYSAMPIEAAKKLCPEGIYLPVNMEKYKKVSSEIYNIFKRYTKIYEPISIDEAFLDVTGKDALEIAKAIKSDIKNELKLTASVGISINKFLAKLASEADKPDGLTIIKKDEILSFLRPLPVNKIWGVGPKMNRELNKLGIYYVRDIQNYDIEVLMSLFGKWGKEIYELAYGIDERPVEPNNLSKSIGEEKTFLKDVCDVNILLKALKNYSINLSNKLKKRGYLARTISIKIKYKDFTIENRSVTLSIPTRDENIIFDTAKYILLNKFNINKEIRLIGLILSNLIYPEDPLQLSMKI
ncbi:DNA polymerase IV [Caproiciproducens sp. MSJ-32]|uniref:DNA polymerase IV n=1 Tax=Caproiciproducens sp. MSJ-32 TaxID=2841527 RepID=UPI001C11A216|nr:DNA polymerase IV [Caproiciproducens sp. MSJ-32]MBU5455436.1 DNA polymerase IV [Caproiciproducens sp. MSJ-32]